MYQGLVTWHSILGLFNGLGVLVIDEVRPFPTVLSQKVVDGIPLILPRMDPNWLHNLIRG